MTEFRSSEWYEVKGVGWEAAVSLDRETSDFGHLLGRGVHIDGTFYQCIGVNHFGHAPPWRQGERIAQSGAGMQFNDDPKNPTGANCYACHQLSKAELSYGTIGPPLYNFGKIRGFTPEMQKYAYGKVYNSQAFSACSNMPRFGHRGILTEKQIKDVVALLMDPESPVNK